MKREFAVWGDCGFITGELIIQTPDLDEALSVFNDRANQFMQAGWTTLELITREKGEIIVLKSQDISDVIGL